MPSPPRILLPKSLVLLTTRIENGLPLVCTRYMEFIIWSVFARAQYLYPIRVCAFVVMGNHLHLLVVVENPDAVAAFMDRIKTELGHAVNLLLGRRQRTVWCVWCDDYDCQPILHNFGRVL